MYFKIDVDKVSDLGDFLDDRSDKLYSLYKDFLEICNKIEDNYKSEDSTIYIGRFRKNIKSILLENEDLRYGGFILKKVSSLYGGQEDNWARQIKRNELDIRGKR